MQTASFTHFIIQTAEPCFDNSMHNHKFTAMPGFVAAQRGDGVYGAYIIRQPKEDDHHRALYDHDLPEHIISIIDWTKRLTIDKFILNHHSDGGSTPDSILINGRGQSNGTELQVPIQRFVVKKVANGCRKFCVVNLNSSIYAIKLIYFL